MSNNLDLSNKIPIILLIIASVIYVVFNSILTFSRGKLNFLSEIYVDGIKGNTKSKYYNTVFANTLFSYTLPIFPIIIFVIPSCQH